MSPSMPPPRMCCSKALWGHHGGNLPGMAPAIAREPTIRRYTVDRRISEASERNVTWVELIADGAPLFGNRLRKCLGWSD